MYDIHMHVPPVQPINCFPYQTPKKIKHKRKPVKMSILKYYKVESDGKIKRLRRECPSAECGAGIFVRIFFY